MTTTILFIIVLGILILVHELGHFIFAKKTGMFVEEFAIGFPPRIFSKQFGETKYSIGLIPLGGFCKIKGEDSENKDANSRDFTKKPKWAQALVIIGGVLFNLIFAWILFSITFMIGAQATLESFPDKQIENLEEVIFKKLKELDKGKGVKVEDLINDLISRPKNVVNLND